ncbi:MAG: type II toxin-antitoxin system HipA family toxin [Alteromonadaceae bacterium]|nr:type II toxin-antitoxin system HipA family toxin [Alteromonadaceae bacterium]
MVELPHKINQIQVKAFGKSAGELIQPSHYTFQYTQQNSISLTMKYQNTPYNYGALHPIFSQNLPEGYVRHYISEKLRRHANVNDMYLLALQLDKGIGHLSYASELKKTEVEQLSLNDILNWQGQENIFHQLLDRYYLNGLVSGVQPKVLVNAVNDTRKPSIGRSLLQQENFIIKTYDDEFPLLTVNEYVCMEAARACGLQPSQCWLSDNLKTFVTERFDVVNGKRLGLEDFTVLMGKQGDEKYQSSYEMLMKATYLFTQSDIQLRQMYQYIIFNCLIGNGDAHLKNFSVQYDENRKKITLTPPYDITHTLIYDTIDNKMALKLNGVKLFPDRKQLVALGKTYNINKPEFIIENIADTIRDHINKSIEVNIIKGLKGSILSSVHCGTSIKYSSKSYIQDKKRKFD